MKIMRWREMYRGHESDIRIDDGDMQEANEGMSLIVQQMDTYLPHRNISQAYEQLIYPQQCQKLVEDTY